MPVGVGIAAFCAVLALSARAAAQSCAEPSIQLVGVGEDLDGIWRGVEDQATGRELDHEQTFILEFDRLVDIDQLASAVHVTGQVASLFNGTAPGDCRPGRSITLTHSAALSFEGPGTAWTRPLAAGDGMSYPLDFNVVTQGPLSFSPSIEAGIAAGGNVELQSFGLNQGLRTPIGLVTGGALTLTNGTVGGDIYASATSEIPQSVQVTGTLHAGNPLPFEQAWSELTTLSDSLALYPATGAVTVHPWGTMVLTGADAALNVFRVDAATFASSHGVEIHAPAGSTVVVDITGTSSFVFGNAGLSLVGPTADRLLWNLASVSSVALSSIGFQGSLIAPRAAVSFNNASFQGTLVARELTGTGSFSFVPFEGWEDFKLTTRAAFTVNPRLFRGCTYALSIDRAPLDGSGHCLESGVTIPFRVAPRGSTRFERETKALQWSPEGAALAFSVRAGVNLTPSEVFDRYAGELRLEEDEVIELSGGLASPAVPGGEIDVWQQRHAGLPVVGRGYTIDVADGYLRRLSGMIAKNLPASTATITAVQAIETLASRLAVPPYPWEASPHVFRPPTATLAYLPVKRDLSHLVYEVNLVGSGIASALAGFVDAENGEIRAITPTSYNQAACSSWAYDSSLQSLVGAVNLSVTAYDSIERSFQGTQWLQGGQDYFLLFSNPVPASGLPRMNSVVLGTWKNYSRLDTSPYAIPVCGPGSAPWNANDGAARHGAVAFWAAQQAEEYFASSGIVYGGHPWTGIYGEPSATTMLNIVIDDSSPADTCTKNTQGGEEICLPNLAMYSYADPNATSAGPLSTSNIFLNVSHPVFPAETWLGPSSVGHEFTHGVIASARARNGQLVGNPQFLATGEALILQEGFADIFGELIEQYATGTTDWVTSLGLRNFVDPGQSMTVGATGVMHQPKPTTYGVTPWVDPALLDPRGDPSKTEDQYIDTTVLSRWFWLLAEGDQGTNANNCPYAVTAVDKNQAAETLFTALLSYSQINPTFESLRTDTIQYGTSTYGSDFGAQLTNAWDAVGVMGDSLPPGLVPAPGAKVDPWPTVFEFPVPTADPWILETKQVAQTWDQARQERLTPEGTGPYYFRASVTLEAGASYEWRARPSSTTNWDVCSVQGSFETEEKIPEIAIPEPLPQQPGTDELREFTEMHGVTILADLEGVEGYLYSVQAGCDVLSEPGAENEPGVFYSETDSFVPESPAMLFVLSDAVPNAADWEPIYYIPGQVYDLAIVPVGASPENEAASGTCRTFQVRWPDFGRPTAVNPGVSDTSPGASSCWDYGDAACVYFGESEPYYEWTPVPDAAGYRIITMEWYTSSEGTARVRWVAHDVTPEPCVPDRNPGHLCASGNPNWQRPPFEGTIESPAWDYQNHWAVEAVRADGYSSRSDSLWYWAGPTGATILQPAPEQETVGVFAKMRFVAQYAFSYEITLTHLESEESECWVVPHYPTDDGVQEFDLSGYLQLDQLYGLEVLPRPWGAEVPCGQSERPQDDISKASKVFSVVDDSDDDGDGYSELDGDCDDFHDVIHPNQVDCCGGLNSTGRYSIDNDCDGEEDEDCTDLDGDRFSGAPGCEAEESGIDCDDQDSGVHPFSGTDDCGGGDTDCDGVADEDCEVDRDGDGAGSFSDCDDLDPARYPGALELCNGRDENCRNGADDEVCLACGEQYYAGGEEGLYALYELNSCGQSFELRMYTYDVKDRVILRTPDGDVLFDSGCVAMGGLVYYWYSSPIEYCGTSVVLEVVPHCDGSQPGSTEWWAMVTCPGVLTP